MLQTIKMLKNLTLLCMFISSYNERSGGKKIDARKIFFIFFCKWKDHHMGNLWMRRNRASPICFMEVCDKFAVRGLKCMIKILIKNYVIYDYWREQAAQDIEIICQLFPPPFLWGPKICRVFAFFLCCNRRVARAYQCERWENADTLYEMRKKFMASVIYRKFTTQHLRIENYVMCLGNVFGWQKRTMGECHKD